MAVVGSSGWVANSVPGSSVADPDMNSVIEFSSSTSKLIHRYSLQLPVGLVGVNGQAWAVAGPDSTTDTTQIYRLGGTAPALLTNLSGMPSGMYADNPVICGTDVYVATILDSRGGDIQINALGDNGSKSGSWIMARAGNTSLACDGTQVLVDVTNAEDGGLFLLNPSTGDISSPFGDARDSSTTTIGNQIWTVKLGTTSTDMAAIDATTRKPIGGGTLSLPTTDATFLAQSNGRIWAASGNKLFEIALSAPTTPPTAVTTGQIVGGIQRCYGMPLPPSATPALVAGTVWVYAGSLPPGQTPPPETAIATQPIPDNGTFDFHLPAGTYTLVASWSGSNLGLASRVVQVKPGQVVHDNVAFVSCQ